MGCRINKISVCQRKPSQKRRYLIRVFCGFTYRCVFVERKRVSVTDTDFIDTTAHFGFLFFPLRFFYFLYWLFLILRLPCRESGKRFIRTVVIADALI